MTMSETKQMFEDDMDVCFSFSVEVGKPPGATICCSSLPFIPDENVT
jgi:hypothetical protein